MNEKKRPHGSHVSFKFKTNVYNMYMESCYCMEMTSSVYKLCLVTMKIIPCHSVQIISCRCLMIYYEHHNVYCIMNHIYINDTRFELHELNEYIKPNCILKTGRNSPILQKRNILILFDMNLINI